jgi:aminopeptidase YwaD
MAILTREEAKLLPKITEEDASYALELVTAICDQVGPGIAASPQERARAEMLRKELELHLGEENVSIEEFSVAPGGFLGSQVISMVLMLVAVLLNISFGHIVVFSPVLTVVIALAFSISALALFILEFILAHELVDPLFKKGVSTNVIGTLRKPETQQIRRLLILSGHHDSAREFNWLRWTGYGFFVLSATYTIGLITVFVVCAIQLVGLISGAEHIVQISTFGWVLLIYPILPSILFIMFFTSTSKNGGNVPGAADNLSACALVVTMARFLAENPSCVPPDTEIRFITFGSEEAGVRGAKRYVRRHLEELRGLEGRLLNYETIAHPEITILTSETNGTVKNSPEMVKSVTAAAQRARAPYKIRPASIGTSSDGGPFSRAGFKATTLLGFTAQQMVAFYHQRTDTPQVLSLGPLLNVLKITYEWILLRGE